MSGYCHSFMNWLLGKKHKNKTKKHVLVHFSNFVYNKQRVTRGEWMKVMLQWEVPLSIGQETDSIASQPHTLHGKAVSSLLSNESWLRVLPIPFAPLDLSVQMTLSLPTLNEYPRAYLKILIFIATISVALWLTDRWGSTRQSDICILCAGFLCATSHWGLILSLFWNDFDLI